MSFTTVARACAISLTASIVLMGCDGFVGQLSPDQLKKVQDSIDKQQQQQAQQPQQPSTQPSNPIAGSAVFSVGEKWSYSITVESPAGKMTGEVTNTVAKIDGDNVTFTSTTALAGNGPITATKTVKLTDADPYKGLVMDESMTVSAPVFTDESVTVPAGTFQARKAAYTGTKDGAEMTINAWATKDKGVIKYDIVTKIAAPSLPAGIPAGLGGMVGGALGDLTTKTIVELKSHSK